MSAERGFDLNRAALLKEAAKVTACNVFRVEADGSLHRCHACGEPIWAHMVVALLADRQERELAR